MSAIARDTDVPQAAGDAPHQYVVVARRYRPQAFGELIGQEHVAQALSNAISTNRVGHAYLFTGARGVGKTSAARILAKALNCEKGPSPVPCNECDTCQIISTGEDVDVLEIDGASNRGIEDIRQLRQNVNIRPVRSRFKIYIIDEVHMLSRDAFNALLKTLEEPPEHVKFIFCTTEPTKIPITILSRCQRFDFAGILTRSIHQRLEQIVAAEGVEAEPAALEVLARRAAGSMRDSQSLLEQLLAFSPGRITVAEVHGMLGTAGEERLTAMVGHLIERNAAAALDDLDGAIIAGVDAGQLIEQLFGCLRDCMVAAVGCPGEAFLYTSPSAAEAIAAVGKRWGLPTLLAVMQILDQTLSRMRYSTQGRILAELALVRISQLEDLDELSEVIARLQSGAVVEPQGSVAAPGAAAGSSGSAGGMGGQATRGAPPSALKKKYEPVVGPTPEQPGGTSLSAAKGVGWGGSCTATPGAAVQLPPQQAVILADRHHPNPLPAGEGTATELSAENAADIWNQALSRLSGMIVDQARQFDSVAIRSPNRLVIRFKPVYAVFKSTCERPEQVARFEQALAEVAGQPIRVEFALAEDSPNVAEPAAKVVPAHQRLLEVAKHPLVRRAGELFGAQPIHVDSPDNATR